MDNSEHLRMILKGLIGQFGYNEVKDMVELASKDLPSLGDIDRRIATRERGKFGGKIKRIKMVREMTGMGLKEAKDFVESLAPYSVIVSGNLYFCKSCHGDVNVYGGQCLNPECRLHHLGEGPAWLEGDDSEN